MSETRNAARPPVEAAAPDDDCFETADGREAGGVGDD